MDGRRYRWMVNEVFKKLGPRQGLGRGAWMAPLGTMSLEEWD